MSMCAYMCFVLFVHDGGNKLYLMRKETKITDIPGNVAHSPHKELPLSWPFHAWAWAMLEARGLHHSSDV